MLLDVIGVSQSSDKGGSNVHALQIFFIDFM